MRQLYLIVLFALPVFSGRDYFYSRYKRSSPLEAMFEWKLLDYDFPTANDRQEAISSGILVPGSGTPIDVDVLYGNSLPDKRVFLTIPRFVNGIPYSLATVKPNGSRGQNGPLIQAYPNYSWHNGYNNSCDGIVSAFRVAINACNQMWVIDSGIIAGVHRCPPKLLLFDLRNDQLIHSYHFESDVYTPSASLFITPAINVRDTGDSCRNTMIYIADVTHHGLVVYNYQQNRAWRVENKYMYPDPDYGTHIVAGENFTLMDGIFALTLDQQNLYFHPLASLNEYSVPLRVLNDARNFRESSDAQESAFRKIGSRRSECAAAAIDSASNIYCVTLNPIKLLVWNTKSGDYSSRTLNEISVDERLLEFVSGMKVVKNKAGKEELWMMSNRFQKIAAGSQNRNEINFRVVKRTLDDLQRDLHYNLIFRD